MGTKKAKGNNNPIKKGAAGVQKKKKTTTSSLSSSSKRQKLKYESIRSQLDESVDPLFGLDRNPQGDQKMTPVIQKSVKKWESNFSGSSTDNNKQSFNKEKDTKQLQSADKSIDDDFLQQIQEM